MPRHSVFSIYKVTEDIVFIVDEYNPAAPTMTVTNDAERVVDVLLKDCGNKRIVYCDTEGQWDELKHDGKAFTGFASYNGEEPF